MKILNITVHKDIKEETTSGEIKFSIKGQQIPLSKLQSISNKTVNILLNPL